MMQEAALLTKVSPDCCGGAGVLVPVPFQDWRLDVVLVTQLWGDWRLLRRHRVGGVSHFQS